MEQVLPLGSKTKTPPWLVVRFQEEMAERGIRKLQIAKRIRERGGVSQATVYRVLGGKEIVDIDSIADVCRAFGIRLPSWEMMSRWNELFARAYVAQPDGADALMSDLETIVKGIEASRRTGIHRPQQNK